MQFPTAIGESGRQDLARVLPRGRVEEPHDRDARGVLDRVGDLIAALGEWGESPFTADGHLSLRVCRRRVRVRKQHEVVARRVRTVRDVGARKQRGGDVLEARVQERGRVDGLT